MVVVVVVGVGRGGGEGVCRLDCDTTDRRSIVAGQIINIETVTMKIPEMEWSDGLRINSKSCQCYDEYHTHQVAFLRIFYKIGPPAYEVVGS